MRLRVKEALLLPKLSRLGGNEQAATQSGLFILKISALIRNLELLKPRRFDLEIGTTATLRKEKIFTTHGTQQKGGCA